VLYGRQGEPEDYIFLEVNPAFEEMTGLKSEAILGKRVTEVLPGIRAGGFDWVAFYGKVALTGERQEFSQYAEPLQRWYKITAFSPQKGYFVTLFQEITEEIRQIENLEARREKIEELSTELEFEEKILFLSYHDQLTGLYNRRFMEEEIKRQDTPRQLPVSVIMGDVNGLKLTNDVFGHRAGDLLLKKAAEVIKECCRREDIIARWGGDEFVILLPRTGMKAAEEIVGRIKNKCALDSEGPVQVSIALGYATKNKAEENIWQVLKEAEEWMYRHKLLQGKSYRNAVISTLKATLFEKSMETEEHAERLKEISLKIAKGLGLSAKQMDELELLAVLHDIGKVAIKESILLKPGPLTEEEWAEMKKHPEIGYRIAQSTPELASIAEYILCHHERWDGRGYPRGIKGEEIPLLSRILAVADAYDAMTSDRPYRKAMGREEALAELERNAGMQFDPEVVSAFIESCCQSDKNFQK
jgi:diguanylate cyclase (GGDEF)-like protein